jgi:hypothetical protein
MNGDGMPGRSVPFFRADYKRQQSAEHEAGARYPEQAAGHPLTLLSSLSNTENNDPRVTG